MPACSMRIRRGLQQTGQTLLRIRPPPRSFSLTDDSAAVLFHTNCDCVMLNDVSLRAAGLPSLRGGGEVEGEAAVTGRS